MKQIILGALIIMSTNLLNAQINAVTSTGDEVFLYQDGTWKYADKEVEEEKEIKFNEKKFIKDEKSTFLVKSKKANVGIWINPKIWSFTRDNAGFDNATEYMFQLKEGDLYGMLISEKIEIPIETLKGIALENARMAAPDIEVVEEEYRMVNGVKVLMMQMTGTLQGMKISYYGYYFSNESGTIQFLTYTSQALIDSYKDDIDKILNGFVEIKE